MPLFVTIVLDGAGVGGAPDAEAWGDAGADTLGHVVRQERPALPALERWGLGRLVDGLGGVAEPAASWGRLTERAAGKDSTTGHWALAGLVLDEAFPTYPDGFPPDVIDAFCARAGVDGVLGNRAASGTAIVADLGAEHRATGRPIVYTSADSVFQVAAHVDVIPLDELYRMCRMARDEVCVGRYAVGRVIARPFAGGVGAYERISDKRKDYSLVPPRPTLLDALRDGGVRTVCVGKIASLFGGAGVDVEVKTAGNADGIDKTLAAIREAAASGDPTFVWTNLVDFDELFGHRNDPRPATRGRSKPSTPPSPPSKRRCPTTAPCSSRPTTATTRPTRARTTRASASPCSCTVRAGRGGTSGPATRSRTTRRP